MVGFRRKKKKGEMRRIRTNDLSMRQEGERALEEDDEGRGE